MHPPPKPRIRESRLRDTCRTAQKLREKNISGEQTLTDFFTSITFLLNLQRTLLNQRPKNPD